MSKLALSIIFTVMLSTNIAFSQKISPYLIGTNVWYNPNNAVWQVQSTAGHKIIRIGGHAYDRTMPSIQQLTTWVNLIKDMGAEPLIQVSQYQNAEAAAAIVRHFNVETNNPVKFWGIGNEPWLQRDKPNMNTIPGIIAGYVRPRAIAMKDIDPSIKIYVANMCYYENSVYQELFNSNGVNDIANLAPNGYYYVDGASWHRYNDGDAIAGANDIIGSMQATRQLINDANILHNRTGDNALGWGIGEFNANAGGGAPCSFGTGQMVAAVYGAAMRYEATFATMWSMFEAGGSCTGTDFSTIGNDMEPRSTFRHMQLIAQNMQGNFALGTSNLGQNIYSFGAVDSNQIAVMVLNRGNATYDFTLRLDNQLSTENIINIHAGIPVDHALQIGANTTLLLLFTPQGQLTHVHTYTPDLYANRNAPQIEEINITPPVPIEIPGTIQSQFFTSQFGFQTEPTLDPEGGEFNIGWSNTGDWLEYTIDVKNTGTFEVSYRVASIVGTGSFALLDESEGILGEITVPETGEWQAFTTVYDTISLNVGIQRLRIQALSDSWNLNWFAFTPLVELPVQTNAHPLAAVQNISYSINSQNKVTIHASKIHGESTIAQLIDTKGTIYHTTTLQAMPQKAYTIEYTLEPNQVYYLLIKNQHIQYHKPLMVIQ
jgi:hypothetical protein